MRPAPQIRFRHTWPWLAVVLTICTLIYWPSLRGPFLFDDSPNLSALTSIEHLSSWRDLGIYLSQARDFPGRPLSMLSFLLQRSDWPQSPLPFKLVNLGIHLACGCLVFLLTRRLSQALRQNNRPVESISQHDLAALLATAAWLLNPMALSGVVLVIQRMTLLMALFVLLGLLAYLHCVLGKNLPAHRRAVWMFTGLGLCTALSFLCKENGILLPLYALVLDATVLRTQVAQLPRTLQWLRRLLIWPAILFVLAYLINAGFAAWGQHYSRNFTLGERLLTEPRVLASYLGNTLLPQFGVYGLYHDNFTVSHDLMSPASTALCVIALVVALVAGLASIKRRPLLAMGILWYLAGQLIESSTVMLELYFEHRNYVPLIGVMVAISMGMVRLQAPAQRKLAQLTYGTWLVACCLATALSARVYASENLLATAWAQAQPDSIRAQTYLAERLVKSGHLDQSLHTIEAAQVHHPDNPGLAENRIYLRCRMGTLAPKDMDELDQLLRTAPFDRAAFENMELLRKLAASKQCPALNDSRWRDSVDILLGNAAYGDNPVSSGFLHYQKHFWAVQRGDLGMAMSELDATYQADPDANIPRIQAKYLVSAGLRTQAIDVLRDTDTSRLPLLRRLLVDDKAINQEAIAAIAHMK
ncbi:hypothetical protein [Dyella telluris]|uniref:Tetratricopeptide repeat protein n=1 Tax=Dyella telluris TaxID=2763498 RepID=A0A7G8Q0R9_9GAMM|nr:hypothetical protein [Dyella telluris]QNK00377.1 hypothetical protein H8F01_14825 [Dyella telluris]